MGRRPMDDRRSELGSVVRGAKRRGQSIRESSDCVSHRDHRVHRVCRRMTTAGHSEAATAVSYTGRAGQYTEYGIWPCGFCLRRAPRLSPLIVHGATSTAASGQEAPATRTEHAGAMPGTTAVAVPTGRIVKCDSPTASARCMYNSHRPAVGTIYIQTDHVQINTVVTPAINIVHCVPRSTVVPRRLARSRKIDMTISVVTAITTVACQPK